ncbi:TPA: adenine-specific methyltransferase EcoRI family protein [Streptococcus suis]
MAGNKLLTKAKRNKKDEFYTQLSDIEKELRHYKDHFFDKHIFCNCDDPEFSNFWRFFALNFNQLGLKRLTSTHYEENGQSYRLDIYRDVPEEAKNKPTFLTMEGSEADLPLGYITKLEENGDFRSKESIEILKDCDIVVTNPPFSLFREYIAQLMEYDKKFIIIGHQNAITYKEVFPYIRNNQIWLGYGFSGNAGHFINHHYEDYATASNHIQGMIRVSGVVWFTNLDLSKRHEELILYKSYSPEEYPDYDNYDAVEVSKVVEIPFDFDGVMGVPITFMNKYNPDQFEIIGCTESEGRGFSNGLWDENFKITQPLINGEKKYKRLFIKRKDSL